MAIAVPSGSSRAIAITLLIRDVSSIIVSAAVVAIGEGSTGIEIAGINVTGFVKIV
jgi:hypothetical protein